MTFSIWLGTNYVFIEGVAKNISPKRYKDLVYYLTLYLDKKWMVFDNIPNHQKIPFVVAWMSNNNKWSGSSFNLHNLDSICETSQREYFDNDMVEETKYYLDGESTFIQDYGYLRGEILDDARSIYIERLNSIERILYDMYFYDDLSMRKISSKLNIPTSSVVLMISALKKKIKNIYDNDYNK